VAGAAEVVAGVAELVDFTVGAAAFMGVVWLGTVVVWPGMAAGAGTGAECAGVAAVGAGPEAGTGAECAGVAGLGTAVTGVAVIGTAVTGVAGVGIIGVIGITTVAAGMS